MGSGSCLALLNYLQHFTTHRNKRLEPSTQLLGKSSSFVLGTGGADLGPKLPVG